MAHQTKNPHLKYWLAFNCIKELGPIRWQILLAYFPSIIEAWQAPVASIIAAGIEPKVAAAICRAKVAIEPDAELEKINRLKLSAIIIDDDDYPALLKSAYGPPMVLYYRGTLPTSSYVALSIVGSRKMSNYGK